MKKLTNGKDVSAILLKCELWMQKTVGTQLNSLKHKSFGAMIKDERGDVPGWVLVVLMTTGLVTAIWTIAAPRLSAILKNSLDAMNGIR